jgi:hypothetical protein
MKLVVEPSGALGMAALLSRRVVPEGRVGVILSGGNIDADTMKLILSSSMPPDAVASNIGELETPMLPSLDGRGWGRVETSAVQHPHPTSPVEGEELNSPGLAVAPG